MKTLEADIEIGADGSVKLLSPLPAWLKPGRAHVLMIVESIEEMPKRQKLTATPEMIATREAALEKIRKLNPYREIADPVEWQREKGSGNYTEDRHQWLGKAKAASLHEQASCL